MDRVFPWVVLVALFAPYYPQGKSGRPPFALEAVLRIHCMQQWFTLSNLVMEEAFFDTPIYRDFAGLDAHGGMPDESTILRFRHRLERHKLAEQILATVNELLAAQGLLVKAGTAVDATLIAAPSSTKNKGRKRDPEMHSSQKGNEWHFGMTAHIGVDADSGLVHTVIGTSGNVADVTEGNSLLHGEEADAFGDAGYQGAHKRPGARRDVTWHVAMRQGKRKALDKENNPIDALIDQVEKIKASIRAKVEHPFRVIKRQFGYTTVRYRGGGGAEEEHVTAQDAVCAVQPVDGAPPIAGGAGMSAPENRQMAAKAARRASGQPKSKAHLHAKRAVSAPFENGGRVELTNSSSARHLKLSNPFPSSITDGLTRHAGSMRLSA